MKYRVYGFLHKTAKKILIGKTQKNAYRMINIKEEDADDKGNIKLKTTNIGKYLNDMSFAPQVVKLSEVYPLENIVAVESFLDFEDSFMNIDKKRKKGRNSKQKIKKEVINEWIEFIEKSKIPSRYKNGGLHYAGYILDVNEWCLPSWIWTNAAIVRMYCRTGMVKKAEKLSNVILEKQETCGGWIVRNDYDSDGAIPMLAPNDSAYIANNCCIEMYLTTKDKKYLDSAIKCANWIIKTAKKDGLVYIGYDMKNQRWKTKHNIVDIGFTAGLFARMYEITGDKKYFDFLEKFVKRYVELFYIPKKHGFATSIDEKGEKLGGMFGRGQAWALEGLIPASRILKDEKINQVIQETIETLLKTQNKQGGWAYNISKPLMGIDCKATSIIGCTLMGWYKIHPEKEELKVAAKKAYKWCVNHTALSGEEKGGIFSYTVEGAIVHHMYTKTAFVYSSAYAIELKKSLDED